MWFVDTFSHSKDTLFILLIVSLPLQKYFNVVPLIDILLFYLCFRCQIKKIVTRPMLGNLLPMFSSRSFMVSCLICKTFIHFELLIFVL